MKIIFFILLSFSCFSSNSQSKISEFVSALQHADSVVLISHIITDEYAVTEPGEKIVHNYPFLRNKNINPEIILKRVIINKAESDNLFKILLKPVTTHRWTSANCDQPHNSILIYKKERLSYIDICFDCNRIHTSKDLQYIEFNMDRGKWNNLENFFKLFQVRYRAKARK